MLTLPPSVKVFVAVEAVDGRNGFDGLLGLVTGVVGESPLSGHLFVFRSKRGNLLRILFWDRTGFCLLSKRLERGRFRFPWTVPAGARQLKVEAAELMLVMEWIDLSGAQRRARWPAPLPASSNSPPQSQHTTTEGGM